MEGISWAPGLVGGDGGSGLGGGSGGVGGDVVLGGSLLVVEAFLAHHVVGYDFAEGALGVVAGVFPVHCSEKVVVEDVFTFDFDGTGVIVAHDELAFGVGYVGNLCFFVPDNGAGVKEFEVLIVHIVGIFVCSAAVERKTEGELVLGNTGLEVGFEGLVGGEAGVL